MRWFTNAYAATLKPCVNLAASVSRPFVNWSFLPRLAVGLVLAAVLAVIVGWPNIWLFRNLEGEFLPEEDKGRLLSFVFAPEGSTTEYTDKQMRKMEAILKDVPEVDSYGAITAFAMAGPGQANQGIVFVRLKEIEDRKRGIQEIVNLSKVPKGSFYHYFESKEAFALGVIEKIDQNQRATLRQRLMDSTLSPVKRLSNHFALSAAEMTAAPGAPGAGGERRRPTEEEIRQRMASMPPPTPSAMRMTFDEFGTFDGVKLPKHISIAVDGTPTEEWTIEKIKVNPAIKAELFQKKQ